MPAHGHSDVSTLNPGGQVLEGALTIGQSCFSDDLPGRCHAPSLWLTSRRTGRCPAGVLDETADACREALPSRQHVFGRRAARDRDRLGGANRRRPSACRPWELKARSAVACGRGPRSRPMDICFVVAGASRGRTAGRRTVAQAVPGCTAASRKHSGTAAVRTGAAGPEAQRP